MNRFAVLNAIALAIALCVQTMETPLAGAWLLFHIAACCGMYKERINGNVVWYFSLGWLATLGISTFLTAPVTNGAATMWILAAMPILALSLRKDCLEGYVRSFLIVIGIYAVGLVVQIAVHAQFTNVNYAPNSFGAYAWPLIDPNNAAAVINAGLIVSFYKALRKAPWWGLVGLFTLALMATMSKAGFGSAGICCSILLLEKYGLRAASSVFGAIGGAALLLHQQILFSFANRLPIWKASFPLLWIHPITGLGLGTFGNYYQQIRTETDTGGWFAHNDLLQLAIEMGIPAVLVFCGLVYAVAVTTTRRNIVSACVLLALFLQAMVKFQFYVPAVSIIAGLALAHHLNAELT